MHKTTATWKRVAFSYVAGIGQKNASLTGRCGEAFTFTNSVKQLNPN